MIHPYVVKPLFAEEAKGLILVPTWYVSTVVWTVKIRGYVDLTLGFFPHSTKKIAGSKPALLEPDEEVKFTR